MSLTDFRVIVPRPGFVILSRTQRFNVDFGTGHAINSNPRRTIKSSVPSGRLVERTEGMGNFIGMRDNDVRPDEFFTWHP